ncbi:hypothetical protein BP6252_02084 [Coleophoma cylindrospora]|uniref:Uncharacterized protein n=1 Tax=Coleophoma cylindrospora TaxID=1849047 RepID=A0A3D8SEG9_9HELO|nr:hypothetical protein BP6252_02084 [Coleophoma cylindrospora]
MSDQCQGAYQALEDVGAYGTIFSKDYSFASSVKEIKLGSNRFETPMPLASETQVSELGKSSMGISRTEQDLGSAHWQ